MRSLTRMVFAVPDILVGLATCTSDELYALGRTRRIAVIPNGVDVAVLTPLEEGLPDFRRRVEILGFLGRFVEKKGLETAIDALALLRADPSFANLQLRLAGSGDWRQRLEEYACLRGVEGAVHFVGTVSGRAKLAFLREIDVLVLVGSHNEGMPYALLEAMAVGTPVIASSVGGNSDVVRHGIDGQIVPPENSYALASAVRDFSANPEGFREMSIASATRVKADFSLQRLAVGFSALYSDLGASIRTTAVLQSHANTN